MSEQQPAGVTFLQAHPEYRLTTPTKLARQVNDPKLAVRTWTRARAFLGLGSVSPGEFAIAYLQAHPELRELPNRKLEELVTERTVSYFTWGRAKKALGIASHKKGNHKVDYHPRKQYSLTNTRTYRLSKTQVEEKATDGTSKVHYIHAVTAAFLAWALLRKEYDYRETVQGVPVFTKSERFDAR